MRMIAGFAVMVLATSTHAALADTKITITKYWVETEISPYPGHYRNFMTSMYTLKTNGTILFHGNGWGQDHNGVIKLGIPNVAHSYGGQENVTRTRFDNGKIIISNFFPSWFEITRILTNRIDSCSAEVEVRLLPGHDVYLEIAAKDHRTQLVMSDIHTEEVNCTIESVP